MFSIYKPRHLVSTRAGLKIAVFPRSTIGLIPINWYSFAIEGLPGNGGSMLVFFLKKHPAPASGGLSRGLGGAGAVLCGSGLMVN